MRLQKQGLDYTPEYRKVLRAARAQGNKQIYINDAGVPQFRRIKNLTKKNAGLVAAISESDIYNVKAVKQRNKTVESKVKQTFEERHKGYSAEDISMRDVFDAVDQFDVYTYDNVVDAIKYYEDKGLSGKEIQQNIEQNINNFVNKYGEDIAQHILRNTDALTKVMTGQQLDDYDYEWQKVGDDETPW